MSGSCAVPHRRQTSPRRWRRKVVNGFGGNLGSAPNSSVGGGYVFTSGSLQANTALAAQAQLDLDAAIVTLNAMANTGGTLNADLLTTVGLIDVGGTLTGGAGGFVPLERLVAHPPDVLVVGAADPRAEDQGSALLAHPALARDFPPEKRIVLPDRLTVCGGPSLPAAFDWLAAEARRVAAAR